jgi:L-ascorbate 6-phosphate lactonase
MLYNIISYDLKKTICYNELLILFSLIINIIPFFSNGQDSTMVNDIINHNDGIGLWWAGHNGWIIKHNDLIISTDILLNYDKRIKPPPISEEELAEILDISFITHAHGDHFVRSVSKVLIEKSKCIFVIPESCLKVAEELKIPLSRIRIAKPRINFELMGIKVEPIRAIHGNENFAIYYQSNMEDCGYVIEIGGKRFLQPGDSFLLEDHLFQTNIDVLFFSPTQHNTYINQSLTLINKLNPKYIFPQHHSTVIVDKSTYFWAKGYQKEVKSKLSKELSGKYKILKQGDKVEIR